jgi:crotonobetainyl-CoA:carnitine CoA-transferase CaiB-like acyl-CoA transferase
MPEPDMLSPYRVLDLTDEKGLLCGKIMADLGADVVKVERPGGDSARSFGPFYHDDPHPEKSLFWFAFNTNKRGITLDIETEDGRDVFRKLVKTADIVVESFPPGRMEELGLGYLSLGKINPRVILVSITPFGQTGPYKDFKSPDIVAWAMGGYMYSVGDADRAPVRISQHSQAYLHAGGQAAQGALLALYGRELTGVGQHLDVSIRDSVTRCTPERITEAWDFRKVIVRRGGSGSTIRVKRTWPCKDGYVSAFFWSGPDARRWNSPLTDWMESEGMSNEFINNMDWDTFDIQKLTQETYDRIAEPVGRFFMAHTKAELLAGAAKHKAQLYPLSTTADILDNPQLASREYWAEIEHRELGATITYPGGFAKTSEAPPRIRRRAPLIGEHNIEIYEKELGIPRDKLLALKQMGAV